MCYCCIIDFTFLQSKFFQLLCYNVEVYILVQSEEEYSLISKAKSLTMQTEKGEW